jgi:hypothetical protein
MRGSQHHAAGHVRDLSFCLKDPSEIELIENRLYVLASVQASMKNFLSSDKDISYYTGFPNVKIFMSVLELVGNPTQYYGYLKKCLTENLGHGIP